MKKRKIKFPVKQDEFTKRFKRTYILVLLICLAFFLLQFLATIFSVSPPNLLYHSVFHQDLDDSFGDFFNVNNFLNNFEPYIQPNNSSYPPLNFIFALPFMLIQRHSASLALTVYLIVEAVLMFLVIFLVKKHFKLNLKATIILSIIFFISAPVLFLAERGNYLFFTFFFVIMFFLFKDSKNKALKEFALISLAIASAMKMYPAIFSVFLLKEKRFKDFFKTVLYAVPLFFLPFLIFKGGFIENIVMFIDNLTGFISYERLSVDVSFTNIFRLIAYIGGFDYLNSSYNLAIKILKCGLVLCAIIAIFKSNEKWKTCALCAFLISIVPHPSMIYSLIFCLISFILFLQKDSYSKIDVLYAVLFTLIFIPFQFGYIMEPVIFTAQYPEIYIDFPNYLGVTVNVFLESLAVTIFTVSLIVDIVKPVPKSKISLKDYVKTDKIFND